MQKNRRQQRINADLVALRDSLALRARLMEREVGATAAAERHGGGGRPVDGDGRHGANRDGKQKQAEDESGWQLMRADGYYCRRACLGRMRKGAGAGSVVSSLCLVVLKMAYRVLWLVYRLRLGPTFAAHRICEQEKNFL